MNNNITVSIKDESFSGNILQELQVVFSSDKVTIKEVIEARVLQEVANYNQKQPAYYKGLIEPSDAEKTLNGFKLRSKNPIDGEKQVYVALDAFQKNGFFVLVDTQQYSNLDEIVQLRPDTQISFIKLTQLVGG